MKFKITSLVLFLSLFYYNAQSQCNGAIFEEQNGIAIIEAETITTSGWTKRSDGSAGGGSYLAYTGSNSFNTPGVNTLTYKVKINSPGTYRFIWRNKIGIIASTAATTEHNDSWLKINASDFYGQKGSSRIYPGGSGKTPNPKGTSSGGWFKIYTNTIAWNWSAVTSDFDAHVIYATFNSAGVYDILVSGRSNGHWIDRLVLYKEGSYTAAQAQSLVRAETRCSGSTVPTPTPTPTPTPEPTPTPPAGAPSIASVQYINSDTENVLGNLTNGTQINLSSINNNELTFRATTNPTTIGSVRFQLTGPRNFTKTDSGAPYSLVGENGSNYYGLALPVGNYSLKLSPYSGSNASGTKGNDVTITFSVINNTSTAPSPTPTPPSGSSLITSFQLYNANTDQPITTLSNGGQIAPSSTPLTIVANTASGVSLVRFQLTGPVNETRNEGSAPFSLFGDIGVNLLGKILPVGSYTLRATPTTSSGTGATVTINFTVGTGATTSAKVAAFAYPNPIEDSKLSVKLPQKEYGTVNYSLKNSSGVEVETGQAQVITSDDQADVNLSSFDRIVPGVYYLTVHSLNGTYTIPIIKK